MFTVEMDHDEIEINILDDAGNNDDVKVHIFDDIVYIRQIDEHNKVESIQMSPIMWDELVAAINSSEGAYRTVVQDK
jgi:hypothetical protein